eukprot:c7338_g1_i3.p1 GENE.c7338_g1_i3~~c7338_g1_i3.p1  ORF type:complete len:429 (-),score=79.51 c7338_g1_i3:16-1302(-)
MLAIPGYMSISNFCSFIASHIETIHRIRVLCHASLSQGTFMAIMKFIDQKSADNFYRAFYGKPFTSLSTETCKLLYVASCEMDNGSDAIDSLDRTELPSCAVCLERLDPKCSGLLTILCNHTFHCKCLTAWKDSPCPVCRYMQEPSQSSECQQCGVTEDLWMCLICGYIGCGRYLSGHAIDHFNEANHTYAMDLVSQRVWDYAGDEWVHRLIQNRSDGKLVAVDDPQVLRDEPQEDDTHMYETMLQSKLESVTAEYSHLLTSQLELQRLYFEDQHDRAESRWREEREELEKELEKSQSELVSVKTALAQADKERKTLQRKLETQKQQLKQAQEEIEFMKSVNDSMKANQELWQKELTSARGNLKHKEALQSRDERIAELEAQVRDIMFALDTQNNIRQSAHKDDIASGVLLMTEGSSDGKKGRKQKPK